MTFFEQIVGAVQEKVWTAVVIDGHMGTNVFLHRSEEGMYAEIRHIYSHLEGISEVEHDDDLPEFFENDHELVLSIDHVAVED